MASDIPELRPPTLQEIEQAARNISPKAIRTPLVRLNWQPKGDATNAPEIYLKLENLQPIGSFKVRPSVNAIANITDKEALRQAGVCTSSAGNFGQGIAWCCEEMGLKCTVVAPDQAPETKLSEIRRRGAKVIKVPYAEWWEIIKTHKCPQAPNAHFIHPGAENSVLAGNATIALEIAQDLPDVDCIIVPWGSGAVCTGIACGIQALKWSGAPPQVFSAEPATAAPFALSKQQGKPCEFKDYTPSFVDGCGGKGVLEEIWAVGKDIVHGGFAVPLEAIADAVRVLAERNRIVAEGAGACPVAAAMTGMCGPDRKKIVCVVSGGGLDTDKLVKLLQGASAASLMCKQKSDKAVPGWLLAAGLLTAGFMAGQFYRTKSK